MCEKRLLLDHIRSFDLFQMFTSRLYWLLYRRRNKFLILLMIAFCILFFVYQNDHEVSSTNKGEILDLKKDYPDKQNVAEKKIRINRETYKTPEPCKGCPGENGQGVQLSVIEEK